MRMPGDVAGLALGNQHGAPGGGRAGSSTDASDVALPARDHGPGSSCRRNAKISAPGPPVPDRPYLLCTTGATAGVRPSERGGGRSRGLPGVPGGRLAARSPSRRRSTRNRCRLVPAPEQQHLKNGSKIGGQRRATIAQLLHFGGASSRGDRLSWSQRALKPSRTPTSPRSAGRRSPRKATSATLAGR